MIRLAIVVEAETEEEFVNFVLVDHLWAYSVQATPHPLGGNVTVERLASEMTTCFWSYDRVTSLVDFYGFRNKGQWSREELETRVHDQVSCNIRRSWDQSRVFPYIQQYEFESLLFSDVTVFGALLDRPPDLVEKLQNIRSTFPTPEEINDDAKTHPSKRIQDLTPSYDKRVDGPLLAEKIGLPTIRAQCPRFGQWVARLESLYWSENSGGRDRPRAPFSSSSMSRSDRTDSSGKGCAATDPTETA